MIFLASVYALGVMFFLGVSVTIATVDGDEMTVKRLCNCLGLSFVWPWFVAVIAVQTFNDRFLYTEDNK